MHASLDIETSRYVLENVTNDTDYWSGKDPVRPELDDSFRTSYGREVYGLKNDEGIFVSFVCVAYLDDIPSSVNELDLFVSPNSYIAVPYAVWSYERGAGREIISQLSLLMKELLYITRVITLSPQTKMAEDFHIRNNAVKLRTNEETVNFEYYI